VLAALCLRGKEKNFEKSTSTGIRDQSNSTTGATGGTLGGAGGDSEKKLQPYGKVAARRVTVE